MREQLDHYLPLIDQAIDQAARRVLQGEQVPATEKLLSLHEPHTQVIRRHKAGKPTEFGRKLWLGEVEGGIISEFRLLEDGGGLEHPELRASLAAHQQRFGRPPNLLAGDRGIFSPENEELAHQLEIKHIVLPKTGRVSKERKAQERFRQISVDVTMTSNFSGILGGSDLSLPRRPRCRARTALPRQRTSFRNARSWAIAPFAA